MKKLFCLVAAILLFSAASAVAGEKIQLGQPKIIDPEIKIYLDEKTIEISFRYEKVAGHIDESSIVIILQIVRVSGESSNNLIKLQVANSSKEGNENLSPDVITQGKATYLTTLPENIRIDYPAELVGAGIVIADCLGRKSLPVFMGNTGVGKEQAKEQKKFEI